MTRKTIIYGGAGGIGSATARLLHSRGETVHLVGRDEEKLADLCDELDAAYTVGDVTDSALFSQVMADAGEAITGLVYAVGTINLRGVARFSEEDFLNDYKINALGAALAIQAAVPALKKSEESASVVFYSTVATQQGFTFHSSVGMAKGAVNGLTLSLAAELAPQIRVNAVAPSLTQTPLAAGILRNDKVAASLAELHALERLGTADDIAQLTAFLLAPESSWITGQIIGVDGGRSMLRTKG